MGDGAKPSSIEHAIKRRRPWLDMIIHIHRRMALADTAMALKNRPVGTS
jgi:hypothetical protein